MENMRMEDSLPVPDSRRNEMREFVLATVLLVLLFLTMI